MGQLLCDITMATDYWFITVTIWSYLAYKMQMFTALWHMSDDVYDV